MIKTHFSNFLINCYIHIKKPPVFLTQNDLRELFQFSEPTEITQGLCNAPKWNNVLVQIEIILSRYLNNETQIIQDFLLFKQKIDALVAKDMSEHEELISFFEIRQDARMILRQCHQHMNVGIVPRNIPYWEHMTQAPESVCALSHGGGLFFLSEFFQGKNKGYQVESEEGGLGIYLDPFQGRTNYGDAYYACRGPLTHFDVPVSMKCEIQAGDIDSCTRHTDEAILRHTNRKKIHITDISLLGLADKSSIASLTPEDLNVYPSAVEQELRIQICQSVLRIFTKPSSYTRSVFIKQLEKERKSESATTARMK